MKNLQVVQVSNGFILSWQDNTVGALVTVGTEIYSTLNALKNRIVELLES